MSAENVIGDVEGLKRDNRERAATLIFDANLILRKLVCKPGAITIHDLGEVGTRLADALVLLEAGGVPTPRLPTARDMER